ncbi:MAG: TIGR01777 family oxidoreductase [Gemmatimonadales bacterium]
MHVEHRSTMPASASEAFAWHARPGAFERLLPPWERVRLARPHPGLVEGSEVELEVGIGPLSTAWVARHTAVEPPARFVDIQARGPFARWEHEHRFAELAPARSELIDRVTFELPAGPIGELGEPFVRRKVLRMLRYRHRITSGDLAMHAACAGPRLTIAVSGSSGLVGRALVAALGTGGHRVVRLVRRPAREGEIQWAPGPIAPDALAGVDAVIHLAGESIAGGRWTTARKERIRRSRVDGTRRLSEAVAACSPRPRTLLVASAMGIYGDRGDEPLEEGAKTGAGFLAEVGRAWEAASDPARAAGIRTVVMRFGLILSPAGGVLQRLRLPFLLGGGGRLGNGRAWMSWIGIDDVVGSIVHLLAREELDGPVNVAAPTPVQNAEFTAVLGRVLRRPTLLTVPAGALRLLFGEMADEALLASSRLVPGVLLRSGYRFRHTDLESALRHLLGRGA